MRWDLIGKDNRLFAVLTHAFDDGLAKQSGNRSPFYWVHYIRNGKQITWTSDLSFSSCLHDLNRHVEPLRPLEINNPPTLRSIIVCLRFYCEGRIAGYVTEAIRSKTDKKASKVGGLFISSYLKFSPPILTTPPFRQLNSPFGKLSIALGTIYL